MKAKVISVSINPEQYEFLQNHEFFSASQILQEGLNKAIEYHNSIKEEKETLLYRIESLQKEIGHMMQYIDGIGKFEEWRKWRNEIK